MKGVGLFLWVLFSFSAFAYVSNADIAQKVVEGLENGHADTIAQYFDDYLQYNEGNEKGGTLYHTKATAQLTAFLENNKATKVTLTKQGDMGPGGMGYIMLKMETAEKKFSIKVFTHVKDGKTLIKQMTIGEV